MPLLDKKDLSVWLSNSPPLSVCKLEIETQN
jgi:hypothetical protein